VPTSPLSERLWAGAAHLDDGTNWACGEKDAVVASAEASVVAGLVATVLALPVSVLIASLALAAPAHVLTEWVVDLSPYRV